MKMTVLPKTIYRSNANSIKIHTIFFTEIEKILKFIGNQERVEIAKEILCKKKKNKKNSISSVAIPDFKIYYRVIVI